MTETHVFTVSELTKQIRYMLESSFSAVWVEGEISNFILHSSGHSYFSLKDKNSVINCVLFKSDGAKLKFDPENGQKVLCRGRISVYDKRGQYQFYVNKMESTGAGALQVAFEKLKKKLFDEGLFDEELKKEIPPVPACVGVVTSDTGAAIKDILKVATRRFPNMEILLRPVRVQGDEAKGEITEAIREFNEYNKNIVPGKGINPVDVLIVGRGGGSLEDLWPFNEEVVARAIADSDIPIVSAVGHEIDYTISDFVADLRAPTPSAAAELVVPVKEDIAKEIEYCISRSKSSIKKRIEELKKEVKVLRESYVLRTPLNFLLQMEQRIDDLLDKIKTEGFHFFAIKNEQLSSVTGKMHVLSPLSVLERGYSITFKDNKAVKSVKSLKKGDTIKTRFHEGTVTSAVKSVE